MMISDTFTYSILRFRPSQITEECVNVGVLFFFPKTNAFEFVFPSRLQRLKAVFPEVNTRKIHAYLKQIKKNADAVQQLSYTNLSEIIDQSILKADDSSLQFSALSSCLYYTSDNQKIVRDFYLEYLSAYEQISPSPKRVDDAFLKNSFYRRIKKSVELLGQFKPNFEVKTNINTISFDYAWRNGALNLVKSASFDLKEASTIQEKAIGIYGSLHLLHHAAIADNLHFDLLIAEPTQKGLSSAFDKGLKTIEKANVPLTFIAKEGIEEYADKAIAHLSKV